MQFLIDTHVHIYPFYQIDVALRAMLTNPEEESNSAATRIACLTERYDCDIFAQIKQGQIDGLENLFEIEFDEPNNLQIRSRTADKKFHLIAGQQIVTKENIEILALNTTNRIPDGLPALEVVAQILETTGIPVVAWAVGKWMFKRRFVVEELLTSFTPKELAIGDTSLRPIGWSTPALMRQATETGFQVLCGSDPMPISGEENRVACYMSSVTTKKADLSPTDILPKLLSDPEITIESSGRRCSPIGVGKRIYRNARTG